MRTLLLTGLLSLSFSPFAIASLNLNDSTIITHAKPHSGLDKICFYNKERQKLRSLELIALAKADQDERKTYDLTNPELVKKLVLHDVKRRKRVGALFGEGCIQTANDYAAAAIIYIHGDTPDHYFQSYFWAQKAYLIGNEDGQEIMPRAIDRYLLSIHKKQLFGTQAQAASNDSCYCIPAIEASFPDSLREQFKTPTIAEQLQMLAKLNQGKDCPQSECDLPLDDTPKGSVPGFW